MLFNSLIFLIFGAAFFLAWPLLRKAKNMRWIYLTAASFAFYGWWDWRFLFLIIGSGLIDYLAGMAMLHRPEQRKFWLITSVIANVASLSVFKYSGFFSENLDAFFGLLGITTDLHASVPEFMLITPIGISFYTFQSMSYTIDVYRSKMEPTRNIFHFFAYLSLFPQLVAGPIVRARELLPQLVENRIATPEQRWEGLRLVVHGYFKKVVVADNLAPMVNAAFNSTALETSSLYWWIHVIMFTFQVYCDFSGYSDIARGLAKWMGYDFSLNFDHPFTAKSIREFWVRWHISLSSWFRDYIYYPLGGSKKGPTREYINLWITFMISGLWHGAAWNFITWGAVTSLLMSVERFTNWPDIAKRSAILGALGTVWAYGHFVIGMAFFRSHTLDQQLFIVKQMFSFNTEGFHVVDTELWIQAVALTILMVGRELWFRTGLEKMQLLPASVSPIASRLSLALLIAICVFMRGPGSAFVYFQF